MADVFKKQKRSEIMSLVRSFGNKTTELAMIGFFKKNGIQGWRRNVLVFGRPDFIFRKGRIAVFVDGCFWHGCPTHGGLPATNVEYWRKKILRNKLRANAVDDRLKSKGWKVFRVWEHELLPQREHRLKARLHKSGILP